MSEGGQMQERRSGAQDETQTAAPDVATAERATESDVLDDVDELLDEIDDVLEENAEEFVRGYVQKGGQ